MSCNDDSINSPDISVDSMETLNGSLRPVLRERFEMVTFTEIKTPHAVHVCPCV